MLTTTLFKKSRLILSCIIFYGAFLNSCNNEKKQPVKSISIKDLKQIKNGTFVLQYDEYIENGNSIKAQQYSNDVKKANKTIIWGDESLKMISKKIKEDKSVVDAIYSVEGYFYQDPLPMLLSDPKWARINAPIPDSAFILLSGEAVQGIAADNILQGSKVKITGKLRAANAIIERNDIDFVTLGKPTILLEKPKYLYAPALTNLCTRYPDICRAPVSLSKNYALLYSGGVNPLNAHTRYWNDLKFMYKTLKSKYGYTDEQIVVVYKDGAAEDTEMNVDYAASPTGFSNAISFLNGKLSTLGLSDLFIFVTNHGGGYNESERANGGGLDDVTPFDEIDVHKIDEVTYYYGQPDNNFSDDLFCQQINTLHFSRLVALFEQCYSGGFLRDLRGSNRVLLSAANEFQYSWAGAPDNHDMFSYYFTCAINKATHTGAVINADANRDGKISMLEAFLYAKSMDTEDELPQLEDTGDGVSSNTPIATAGQDGNLANTTFIH